MTRLLAAITPGPGSPTAPTWQSCIPEGDGVATLQCVPVVFSLIVQWAVIFAGVVAVGMVMFAGYKYMKSGGEQKEIEGAKKTLTYAIIGLIVIIMSFFIINIISYLTGVDCLQRFGFECR